RQVRERVAADDLERRLGAVDEAGRAARPAGHDVGRREQVAVRGERDRRARAAAPAVRRPDAEARDRRDEALGRAADRPRVGVEDLVVEAVVGVARVGAGGQRPEGFGDHRAYASPEALAPPPTDTVRSSVPRTTLTSNGIGVVAISSWSWSASVTGVPAISTMRSPSRIPA